MWKSTIHFGVIEIQCPVTQPWRKLAMSSWKSNLLYDPIPPLLNAGDPAVTFFVKRDLLGENGDVELLWNLPIAQKLVRKQQPDGSWLYPGGNHAVRSAENYNQLETFRNLGYLVEMYGFDRTNPVVAKAADFIFHFQTNDGDIRGILGNQYTPYYTAGIVELLIKAGYGDDPRVLKAFTWLKSIRQDDGGWAIPLRTQGKKLDIIEMEAPTLEPDRSKPFSHLVTGVVLRAYAAHETYRNTPEALVASRLLLSSLFHTDSYPDRGSKEYWLRFTYPFWFTDLISAVDSLSKLGMTKADPQIAKALEWFIAQQSTDGLWKLKTLKNQKKYNTDAWLSLAICRLIKRLYS